MGFGAGGRFAAVAGLMLSVALAQTASGSPVRVLGFDDIPNELNTRTPLPTEYAGLAFSGSWQVETYGYYNGSRGNNLSVGKGIVNPQHLINLAPGAVTGGTAVFSSAVPFYLRGLTLTAFLTGDRIQTASTVGQVRVDALLAPPVGAGGGLPSTISFTAELVRQGGSVWIPLPLTRFDPLAYGDIWGSALTQVSLTPQPLGTARGTLFVMDDLQVQAVPLPPSAVLLLPSLVALGLARRQTRRSPV